METQVRTPQMVFAHPQRLVVPLFQRPYVWNEENQWEPLWNDVVRLADTVLKRPRDRHQPHFLGAVVLQQMQTQTGQMQERTIIDGQQRLTTLQLLLDALHAEFLSVQATQPALRLEPLVTNAEPFCSKYEDRFKVWPTNRDRAAFNAVMGAVPPVDYDATGFAGQRMVKAHRFFAQRAREWLPLAGPDAVPQRAATIETVVRDLLQIVVIDLSVDENAQEIFETLNARGASLSAADLVKNFVFQRLQESGTDVEAAYERNWKEFETGFWEAEISVGRLRYPRSSIFLNHWLIARTGKEVLTTKVFERFKTFADHDADVPMARLLEQVRAAAGVYREFIDSAAAHTGPIERLGLFGYRTGVLESEVIKPLILCMLDPQEPRVADAQLVKTLEVVESWMVRRMLVRVTAKNYNQVVVDLVKLVRGNDRARAGDAIESFLASQSSASAYWPDDRELRDELQELPAYRRLGRGRLRMVLEAIEDFRRGWRNGKEALGGERVARAKLAIEHVMPRKWHSHWPLQGGSEVDRDHIIHTLGNLTLLTGKLNSKASNSPWVGNGSKREALREHDVLFLNRAFKDQDHWNEETIGQRTRQLIDIVLQIWPVPPNHRSGFSGDRPRPRKNVDLADLIIGEVLGAGMTLTPRRKKFSDRVATLLSDGRVDVDGEPFSTPSDAASKIAGKRVNGWAFFLTDETPRRSLRAVRRDYVNAMAVDVDDDDPEDDGDEDEG